MSTSDPTTTLTTSTTTSTSQPLRANSSTTTLYLFTFLATILILVLLSASLVLRSYILRRRYRQRFQQAIAGGLFVDLDRNDPGQLDALGGFRRSTRRFGPKPVMWDTWIHPAEQDHSWSSIVPVAVQRSPLLSLPSSSLTSSLQSEVPSSLQAQTRPSFFSQLRISNPFSLSTRRSDSLARQGSSFIRSPNLSSSGLPPAASTSPDPSDHTEEDVATLAVCVLVAMPDVSSPVHRPVPTVKGKGVDPLESQSHPSGGDRDPVSPSSQPQSCAHVSYDGGLPSLEFGVIEVKTGDWIWKTSC